MRYSYFVISGVVHHKYPLVVTPLPLPLLHVSSVRGREEELVGRAVKAGQNLATCGVDSGGLSLSLSLSLPPSLTLTLVVWCNLNEL